MMSCGDGGEGMGYDDIPVGLRQDSRNSRNIDTDSNVDHLDTNPQIFGNNNTPSGKKKKGPKKKGGGGRGDKLDAGGC